MSLLAAVIGKAILGLVLCFGPVLLIWAAWAAIKTVREQLDSEEVES